MSNNDKVDNLLEEIARLVHVATDQKRVSQFIDTYRRMLDHFEDTGVEVKYDLRELTSGIGNIFVAMDAITIYNIDSFADMVRSASGVEFRARQDGKICITLTFNDIVHSVEQ